MAAELNKSIQHIAMPDRMRRLPISETGYPVPYFVAWLDDNGKRCDAGHGKPDFRIIDTPKVAGMFRARLCWLCGQAMGQYMTFTIGPMCLVNMTSAELPSHFNCALYAAKACPFLTKPRMRRNDDGKETFKAPAGIGLDRNPGVVLLLTTKSFKPFSDGSGGTLFEIGKPTDLQWFCEGRKATREEVLHSFETGMPHLRKLAEREGKAAVADVDRRYARALAQLPKEQQKGTAA